MLDLNSEHAASNAAPRIPTEVIEANVHKVGHDFRISPTNFISAAQRKRTFEGSSMLIGSDRGSELRGTLQQDITALSVEIERALYATGTTRCGESS